MQSAPKIKAAIITGQSSQWHNWRVSHAALASILDGSGLFDVTVVIAPPAGADMSGFVVDWDAYDVAVIDYEGDDWPRSARDGFERFVSGGGGAVIYHASDNAFPDWAAYNEMMAIGGWAGRDERSGPMLRWRDGQSMADYGPGIPYHPEAHAFVVTARLPEHPIMRGLPPTWLHATDEMYSRLRGPARKASILATACADPRLIKEGSGENEPMLLAIEFGEGRVFHTTLGHVGAKDVGFPPSLLCQGFATTFLRGTEWAATGSVNQPPPADFPTADSISLRS